MNILITGAAGFVGSHLVRELQENGHTALATVHAGQEPINGIENYQLDLMDQEAVNSIDFSKLDGVIHLAGLAAVGPSFDAPNLYLNTNAGIEVNLFEAAIKQDTRPRFLVISSGSLYDPLAPLPLNEDSVVLPNSPYAVSKIAQEQFAHYYGKRGFEYMIARPFNHIGPGQNLGFIVPDLAKQIVNVEKGTTDKIMVGNLDAKRDYTDVRDIVHAYRLLIEKGTSGKTYNICSGSSVSGKDILAGLLSLSRATPKVEQDPARMRPADVMDIYGDSTRLARDTGWSTQFALRTTLADALEDWRNR